MVGRKSQTHPCFDPAAHGKFGRVHLPVAPKCNLGCNFCNRKFDCMNESRPGVTSTLLTPAQSVVYLRKVMELVDVPLSVVGIAGPGDPFANGEETMATLRLVRENYPSMILCVASNGLNVSPYVEEMAELDVSHVTITVNAVDAEIGKDIYRFVRPDKKVYRGLVGAQFLLARQLDAIRLLKEHGITVKVNSIVIPGVNDHHIETIAETVAQLGADYHNCMALCPVADTPFENVTAPDDAMMRQVRDKAEQYVPQMKHCARCRADAVGRIGEDNSALVTEALIEASRSPIDGSAAQERPYVAVASLEGMLVNQHLGQAEQLWIFEERDGGQYEVVETRPTPLPGSGGRRWDELAARLADCRSLVCSSAGSSPQTALARQGVRVQVAEGLIHDALEAVYSGRKPRMPLRVLQPSAGCDTDGVGCGGCVGPGTGCG